MTFTFSVRKIEDIPPAKTDKYFEAIVAFKNLRGDEALLIDAETSEGRALSGILRGIRTSLKRNGITAVDLRTDAKERGVWVWRKAQAEAHGAPAAPLDQARPRVPGAGVAAGQ